MPIRIIQPINLIHKRIKTPKTIQLGINQSISCSGNTTSEESENSEEKKTAEPRLPETSCAFCKKDFTGIALEKLSVYPICESCKADLDKKIFPLWVKLFFTGVILLVIFSMFWNWRFYSGYNNMKKSLNEKDLAKAEYFMKKASSDVPENNELAMMASYYTGIDLLKKDKSTEALAEFDKCKDLPPDFHVNEMVLQAEMGSGFDKKDYQLFLTSAKAFLQLDTTKSQSWAGVASAYACLYAQNNADSGKIQSLKYLNKAKAMDDTSADAKEFYGRILYRIDTREIITKEQFDQKYPNGYTSINLK